MKFFRQNKVARGNGEIHPLALDFALGCLRLGIAIEHDGNLGDGILHGDDKSIMTHAAQTQADEGEQECYRAKFPQVSIIDHRPTKRSKMADVLRKRMEITTSNDIVNRIFFDHFQGCVYHKKHIQKQYVKKIRK